MNLLDKIKNFYSRANVDYRMVGGGPVSHDDVKAFFNQPNNRDEIARLFDGDTNTIVVCDSKINDKTAFPKGIDDIIAVTKFANENNLHGLKITVNDNSIGYVPDNVHNAELHHVVYNDALAFMNDYKTKKFTKFIIRTLIKRDGVELETVKIAPTIDETEAAQVYTESVIKSLARKFSFPLPSVVYNGFGFDLVYKISFPAGLRGGYYLLRANTAVSQMFDTENMAIEIQEYFNTIMPMVVPNSYVKQMAADGSTVLALCKIVYAPEFDEYLTLAAIRKLGSTLESCTISNCGLNSPDELETVLQNPNVFRQVVDRQGMIVILPNGVDYTVIFK